MNFRNECASLVVKVVEELEDKKLSQAVVPIEVAPSEVAKKTKNVERKKKKKYKKTAESKLKFISTS